MGRVKGGQINRIAKKLVKSHGRAFGADFTKNKTSLKKVVPGLPTMQLNKLAGQVTNLKTAEFRRAKLEAEG
ncbi:MAG: hypothetical protein V1787_01630 [Candidatus Micrarchaeota archaeon]